jgi:ParB family transcriptional regulator, chromosome partitioning protein
MTVMTGKKRGLRRGLGALLGQVAPKPMPGIPPAREQPKHVPMDLLQRGAYLPRQDMREESLEELADSITAEGVVQPIVVRPLGTPEPGQPQRYEIIAGERRWRAAQMSGCPEIPAVVRRVEDEDAVARASTRAKNRPRARARKTRTSAASRSISRSNSAPPSSCSTAPAARASSSSTTTASTN